MKIRQGFVSNSSSSSFICEVSNPEEVAKSLDLIKSEILNEKKLTPYQMDVLAKYIQARIETYENIINAEEWEIKNLYDVCNFDVDAFYDCFKRDITIKEWLKENWANKLRFEYSDDDFRYDDSGREFHPEWWIKCKVQVECMR